MYDIGSEEQNVKAYLRDLPIRREIQSHPERLIINPEKQDRHMKDEEEYISGRSYITVSGDELQEIVNRYAGTGEIQRSKNGKFASKEIIFIDHQIWVSINPNTFEELPTNEAYVHYSKSGTHVVPTSRRAK